MVERVHGQRCPRCHDAGEQAVGHDVHGVGGIFARHLLVVLDEGSFFILAPQVLIHLAAQCGNQHLDAAADAQHRDLSVVGHADEAQLGLIALRADAVEAGHRLGSREERVEVGPAAEHDAVEAVEQAVKHSHIAIRRDDYGHAARTQHRRVISLGQLATFGAEVARYSNDGPALPGRGRRAEGGVEAGFPVER